VKIGVILNGISLAKDTFYKKYLPFIEKEFEVEVFETRSMHDATTLASKTVQRRFDIVISAGGDGTINQIINGLYRDADVNSRVPVLGILPLGSGNDFARTFDVDYSPVEFVRRLKNFEPVEIDLGEVHFAVRPPTPETTSLQDSRYFVNVVDVGMGPPVVRGVLDSGRAFGSAFAYYKSILKTFFTYKPLMLHAKGDDWEWNSTMRTFAVANAKYYGNGLCIAPEAQVNDGVFNIFACGPVSVLDFIVQSIPLKQGKKLKHSRVFYFKSKTIEMTSPSAVEIEADGEIIGWLPAKVRFSARRLKILI
jgi:diacylglycerol kinase (ATP)